MITERNDWDVQLGSTLDKKLIFIQSGQFIHQISKRLVRFQLFLVSKINYMH